MSEKAKNWFLRLALKYWVAIVRWLASLSPWVYYPLAGLSGLLLLTSWGTPFPVDWLPVIDEAITLKLAGLSAHAFLVRQRVLRLTDERKGTKKLRQGSS